MKYWIPKNWGDSFKHDGLLFFVQRMQEMLFHFSRDIYRAPVHNTSTLIHEFLQVSYDVSTGVTKAYQLTPLFSELYQSLITDKIIIENLGQKFVDSVGKEMKACQEENFNALVRYLEQIIVPNYLVWTVKYLLTHIPQENHKEEIEKGARSWVSEMIMRGYTSEYIYYSIERYLVNVQIVSLEKELGAFFDRFNFENKKHRVFFQLSEIMEPYIELLKNRLSLKFDDDGNFYRIQKKKKHIICYFEIEAMDFYRAIDMAYNKINIFLKYYRFIVNYRKYLLYKFGVVIEVDTDEAHRLPIIPTGFKAIEVERDVDGAIIDEIILGIQANGRAESEQLSKAIELHNSAIRQQLPKDGFISLWSIFEVLCPQGNRKSKLDPILEAVLPIMQNDYFEAVFDSIYMDLKDNLNEEDFHKLLSELEYSTVYEQMAAFCVLPEYEKLREEYFKLLSKFPIIRNKIYTFYLVRDNKKEFFEISKRYCKRVKWHIYRLYRTRNSIIHAGIVPNRVQVLGEHLHSYVDSVMNEIALKMSHYNIQSISNVFMDTALLVKSKEAHFSEIGKITHEDILTLKELYFCPKDL